MTASCLDSKMRFVELVLLIDKGNFTKSPVWTQIISDLRRSVEKVNWPSGSERFILYNDTGRGRGQGNGVVPIKTMFQSNLEKCGWKLEQKLNIATYRSPGKIDACMQTANYQVI